MEALMIMVIALLLAIWIWVMIIDKTVDKILKKLNDKEK